ncbi:hypothetical protein BC830DRAFT_1076558 [Chytriomyces sp. MP71]|nr:hypothetical protein BC830DRAFT_1076558 [Chytriomyces sp. MP71]
MKGDSTRGRGRPRLDLSVEAAKEARREQLRLAQKTYKKRAATREGDEKARLNDRIARLEARLRVVEAENVALRRWFLQPSQADLSADVQIPPPPEKEIPHFDATHFEHLTAATAALKATPSLFRCQADAVPLIDALAALVSTFATNCMEQIASNQLACPIPQAPDIQGVKHALLALCDAASIFAKVVGKLWFSRKGLI